MRLRAVDSRRIFTSETGKRIRAVSFQKASSTMRLFWNGIVFEPSSDPKLMGIYQLSKQGVQHEHFQ
jgi:hypothetical protein